MGTDRERIAEAVALLNTDACEYAARALHSGEELRRDSDCRDLTMSRD